MTRIASFPVNDPLRFTHYRLVDELPDNATWDDVMRKAYERQAIEAGLDDSEAGRV